MAADAPTDQAKSTLYSGLTWGALGAAAGAVIGAVTGDPATGAALGGASGGLLGAAGGAGAGIDAQAVQQQHYDFTYSACMQSYGHTVGQPAYAPPPHAAYGRGPAYPPPPPGYRR